MNKLFLYKKEYKKQGFRQPAKLIETILVLVEVGETKYSEFVRTALPLYAKIEGIRGENLSVNIDVYNLSYIKKKALENGFAVISPTDTIFMTLDNEIEQLVFWGKIRS